MRLSRYLSASLLLATLLATQHARADQARDWMFGPQPGGLYGTVDAVLPGIQLGIEHRTPIYNKLNELSLKASLLPTLFFVDGQAGADVRILVLTVGGAGGFRNYFHGLTFAPGENFDQAARRKKQYSGDYSNEQWLYAEGHAALDLPLNDYLFLRSWSALRYEGGPDRIFDWRLGIVRDSGVVFQSDTTGFIKHRQWGALGGKVQLLNYALDGKRNWQVNLGGTIVTRPGLTRRNDVLYLSALLGVVGKVNGRPTQDVYGIHFLHLPITIEVAYRAVFEIIGPKAAGADDD